MLRRRTRWFRRLAAGLAFATLAAPAAAKVDESGGGNAAAATKVISYLSHGMTTPSAAQVVGNDDAMTHRQLEELAASAGGRQRRRSSPIGRSKSSPTQAIGNGDALTHRQMEELATLQATTVRAGRDRLPQGSRVEAPTVINYLSQGLTAEDALDPLSGIPLSAGIPVAGAEVIPGDPSFGTFPEEPMSAVDPG